VGRRRFPDAKLENEEGEKKKVPPARERREGAPLEAVFIKENNKTEGRKDISFMNHVFFGDPGRR